MTLLLARGRLHVRCVLGIASADVVALLPLRAARKLQRCRKSVRTRLDLERGIVRICTGASHVRGLLDGLARLQYLIRRAGWNDHRRDDVWWKGDVKMQVICF